MDGVETGIKTKLKAARHHLRHESLILPVAAAVLATACLVSPVGEFPLNDDWTNAKAIQWTLEQGRYVGHPFPRATLVAHVLYGAAFAAVFGFSFTILRISSLILAVVTLWAVARTARECGLSRRAALLCAAILWCNPIFLNLSYTFMSETSFWAATALSLLFFVRALNRNRAADVFLGAAFSVVALFVRHFGVLSSAAFALIAVAAWIPKRRRPDWAAVAAFLAPWAAAVPLLLWWTTSVEGHPNITSVSVAGVWNVVRGMPGAVEYAFIVVFYLGLFLMPAACGLVCAVLMRRKRWTLAHRLGFVAFAIVACLYIRTIPGWRVPPLPNVLRNLGTGPLTLQDTTIMARNWTPVRIGPVTLGAVMAMAIVSASALFVSLWMRMPPMRRHDKAPEGAAADAERLPPAPAWFLLVSAVLFFASAYNPWLPYVYDRYLLTGLMPALVLCMAGLSVSRGRAVAAAVLAPCLLYFAFSACCVQDYLAWNRARWTAIDKLLHEHGASPFEIDGGYEYNGMYTSDEFMRRNGTRSFLERGPLGWWVLDDTYAVSFLPRPGYRELGRVEYFSPIGMERRAILMLRRDGEAPDPANNALQDKGIRMLLP
ncbi:MAG: glycosyltransferase family 39 protein [Candidatus Hydrogenedentes bacterium]|nr:glycosyltransferase family 39 protein [Candidatus Hydrogenedentota bacterium]